MIDRVLVTGGTGFTGSHLVRDLVSDGHRVRVVSRDVENARAALPPEVEVVGGDIAERDTVRRAVEGMNLVFHLAAAFREPGIPDSRYHEVHVDGTRHLLEAARDFGVRRVVHVSTIGVHSHIRNPPADETWPHTPGDIYQETKSEAEKLAQAFSRETGLPLTVIRPAGIYGPGDLRLLKLFRAVAHQRFAMIGDGETLFHMVHVRDLVRAFRRAAARATALGEVFIIAGPEYTSLNELVRRIATVFNVRPPRWRIPAWPVFALAAVCEAICIPLRVDPPLYRRRVAFFTKDRAFRTDKARCLLGFTPEVSLDEGLKETGQWYLQQGLI